MATDRERTGSIVLITRITYLKPGPDLLKRTRIKIKDKDGVTHVVSDVEENVGKKSTYKQGLVAKRKEGQNLIDNFSDPILDEIAFLNEQITDIEAL